MDGVAERVRHPYQLLHGLVAEGGQVLGVVVAQCPDLRRRQHREDVAYRLDVVVVPELRPEGLVVGRRRALSAGQLVDGRPVGAQLAVVVAH